MLCDMAGVVKRKNTRRLDSRGWMAYSINHGADMNGRMLGILGLLIICGAAVPLQGQAVSGGQDTIDGADPLLRQEGRPSPAESAGE
jgi:hypothetical protein